ncbi:MAG: phosphate ABC transporter substrate-binding/OmpA family protein [Paracoccaceae bacterium]
MRVFRATICVALFQMVFATVAMAQDVTLTSRDGSVEIGGSLLSYDGEFYRVDSVYGVLTVDGSGVLCAGPGCPDLDSFVANISISGASTIGNALLPALITAFAVQQDYDVERIIVSDKEYSYVLNEREADRVAARFSVRIHSSDEGFADLLAEETDIAMSLREVLPDEVTRGVEAGLGLFTAPRQNRVIALDALVPVVSPRNPVLEISPDDLSRVFSQEVTNWQDLGGLDAPIILHSRNKGSGVTNVFLEKIILPSGRSMATDIQTHNSNADLVDAVARDPFAIGMTTLSEPGNTRPLTLIGGCGFKANAAPEALKSEDYPLTAPLFLYLKSRRLPAIGREFMRFIQSPAAQIAVLRAGFVDQAIARTPLNRQGDRLANAILNAGEDVSLADIQRLVSTLNGSRRLSVTFRFKDGSKELDAQSRSNIVLLARALETGTIGSGELTFVGFSDGLGAADANKRLSRQRAASVREAVKKEAATADPARISLKVEAFGEAMPMACDDTEWGRQINRRVEVWSR